MTSIKEILADCDHRMGKAVESCVHEMAKIRTGRASTALLDTVRVDAYGSATALNQVANITTPDAHTIAIQSWDKGLIGAIEKAILAANLGLTPTNDGNLIRVTMPKLTEEHRKELVKLVKKIGEEAKVSIRNVRRDAMENLKKAEKDQHFREDDRKRGEDEVQKKTDGRVKEIDAHVASKEKDVMAV